MNQKLLLTALLGTLLSSTTQAGTYEWTSGWGQGVTEYLVDDGNGNGLNIACSSEDDQAVRAYASISGQEYSSESDEGLLLPCRAC